MTRGSDEPPRLAPNASQVASDEDHDAADADQSTSDADQTASDADEAQAGTDQAASDRDQAAADRDFENASPSPTTTRTHEVTRVEREQGTAERGAAHLMRSQSSAQRLETATLRDEHAERRDAAAGKRDHIDETSDREAEMTTGNGSPQDDPRREAAAAVEEVRKRSAANRVRAAGDRARAAEDRRSAAEDRKAADDELERAYVDHLTGAYRRGVGEAALNNELVRAKREETSLIVAFIDVNGLKAVNDRHGHAAGDALLHEVAAAIRLRLRPYDPLVRVGGDEFVCGVSGLDMDAARARFAEIETAIVGGSISVGLAAMEPEDTLETLMERSDSLVRPGRREA